MTITTLIDGLRAFIITFSGLDTGAPVSVDHIISKDTEYSIVPLPGARITDMYLNGGSERQYPFALEFSGSTAADDERIGSNAFAEAFADWLESQTLAGTLPTLATKKTATKIEALNWGFLAEQSGSEVAIYQIQCLLTYDQAP